MDTFFCIGPVLVYIFWLTITFKIYVYKVASFHC